MGRATPIEFQCDEPGTFPQRTYSGKPVRIAIVRSISNQHESFKEASRAADRLLYLLEKAIRPRSIPPAALRSGTQRTVK